MAAGSNRLLMAFYGDDFTGSTDALEFLSIAGIKTVLFIEPPSQEQLGRYTGLQAIGVAGLTRAMAPKAMEKELQSAFAALKALDPQHVHYKVCSTFDSSPEIGSIGKAIDIGLDVFEQPFAPLLVAAPVLGRHCVFGNLFARMGIGSNGDIFRLDRHPSMSRHPTTPATESDLRLHLSKQTSEKIGLIDILQIQNATPAIAKGVEKLVRDGTRVILFDALYQEQMKAIGQVIDANASGKPFFSVGSSGVEMALSGYWQSEGLIRNPPEWEMLTNENILVLSGSCSPVTAVQIEYAISKGFEAIAVDTEILAKEGAKADAAQLYANSAIGYILQNKSVIIHTSRGNDDERVSKTDLIFRDNGIAKTDTAALYGTILGQIARLVAEKAALKRIVIAGGDTSSYAARAMGIEAVEMISPLSPGAPLCRAYAPGSPIDGLEVNFKGGQVGKQSYFESAASPHQDKLTITI